MAKEAGKDTGTDLISVAVPGVIVKTQEDPLYTVEYPSVSIIPSAVSVPPQLMVVVVVVVPAKSI